MASRIPPTAVDGESRRLARGGLASLLGAAASALAGFLLTVVLARSLGDSGTGIVLQAIAVFSIALSFARSGMDSAVVWLLPRLALAHPEQIRGALVYMLSTGAIAGSIAGGLLVLASRLALGRSDENTLRVADTVAAIGWFVPFAAMVLIAVAATRGLGGIWPYVAIGGLGLPTARLVAVAVAATAGGSLAIVALGWAAPLPIALAIALVVLSAQVSRHERGVAVGKIPWHPPREVRRQINGYALPRTLSAGLEQAILWLDVLIVGAIAGSAASGVYGGASRFVAAGLIVDTALRMVVSPRFSSLLHAGRIREVQALYRTAARWLVLFSAPVSIMLAVYAPVVLGWLGPGFSEGSVALAILCAGSIVTFTAGNIQSVLLMSGHSGWAAFNKSVVLLVNIAGNVLLVPVLGITGAAVSWAVSMLIDAMLATIEVRRLLGLAVDLLAVGYALLVPVVAVGVPAVVARLTLGASMPALLLSLGTGGVVFLIWCAADSRRLQLRDLAVFVRAREPGQQLSPD